MFNTGKPTHNLYGASWSAREIRGAQAPALRDVGLLERFLELLEASLVLLLDGDRPRCSTRD